MTFVSIVTTLPLSEIKAVSVPELLDRVGQDSVKYRLNKNILLTGIITSVTNRDQSDSHLYLAGSLLQQVDGQEVSLMASEC